MSNSYICWKSNQLMKQKLLTFFLFLGLIFACKEAPKEAIKNDEKPAERISTKAENVIILDKEFAVKNLDGEEISRKIWLYLPPDYQTSTEKYPVIYMHDGQNLFDDATSFVGEWKVDEILNELHQKTGKGFIVVGIENNGKERLNEYSPFKNEKYGGGNAEAYVTMIVDELKPFIDNNYRTKTDAEHTAIIGSSMGGLVSFYAGLEHPNVFGKVGALSTSFWFSEDIFSFAEERANQPNTKIYFLIGGQEGDTMVPDTQKMEKLLFDKGFPEENIKTKIVEEGKHTESFWSNEFLEVITFLYEI